MIRILVGDCRQRLKEIESGTVQVCVTSPPYFGLRDYDTEPLVFGGRGDCEHAWTVQSQRVQAGGTGEKSAKQLTNAGSQTDKAEHAFCRHCQAWRGHLGLEPRLEMYVSHLVDIFRGVRRVLRDDGILILNLGDSYSKGSGDRVNGSQGKNSQVGHTSPENNPDKRVGSNLPPKNLFGVPWRVALALQADGWFFRSAMPWLKASGMPESVQDRPTTAHEYVFLFAKSKKYYWDADAMRVGNQIHYRKAGGYKQSRGIGDGAGGQDGRRALGFKERDVTTVGRNYRTTDAYIAPLDHAIAQARDELVRLEALRDTTGLLLDERGNPVALRVNPGNFPGKHFAVFPTGLVEPFVEAGTSEKGACPGCGSAWVRVVKSSLVATDEKRPSRTIPGKHGKGYQKQRAGDSKVITAGWQPPCTCPQSDPVPQTVLDIFGGAMTTMMVADRLGRDGIACELNPDYAEMGRQRLADDGGMFIKVSVE